MPRYALPGDHPKHVQHLMLEAAELTERGELDAALANLDDIVERETDDLSAPYDSVAVPEYGVLACVYAYLLEVAAAGAMGSRSGLPDAQAPESHQGTPPETPSGVLEDAAQSAGPSAACPPSTTAQARTNQAAAASGEGHPSASTSQTSVSGSSGAYDCLNLVRYQLGQRTKGAAKDSLLPVAQMLQQVLGPSHAVTKIFFDLADRNLCDSTRRAMELRRQQLDLARQARLLRAQEIAAGAEIDPSRYAAALQVVRMTLCHWLALPFRSSAGLTAEPGHDK